MLKIYISNIYNPSWQYDPSDIWLEYSEILTYKSKIFNNLSKKKGAIAFF